jgi:hypothetical protein
LKVEVLTLDEVFEKSRTPGAKDKRPRKKRGDWKGIHSGKIPKNSVLLYQGPEYERNLSTAKKFLKVSGVKEKLMKLTEMKERGEKGAGVKRLQDELLAIKRKVE